MFDPFGCSFQDYSNFSSVLLLPTTNDKSLNLAGAFYVDGSIFCTEILIGRSHVKQLDVESIN